MADIVYMAKSAWTALLDAIRSKGGTSALMTAAQAKAAVEAIETGGGDPNENLIKRITNTLTSFEITEPSIGFAAFALCSNLTRLTFPQNIVLGEDCCRGIGPSTVHLHNATFNGYNIFRECPNLVTFVCENATIGSRFYYLLYSCQNLTTVDIKIDTLKSDMLTGTARKINTIILRKTDGITALQQIQNLTNQNAFKNGGTGGAIYIHKALYDHLGDGSSLDYQAATNWSTVHGYGTITWEQIEGSRYETQYADGTPIT